MHPEALQNGRGRAAAVMLSQAALGHDVVFSAVEYLLQGEAVVKRNLFSLILCFHVMSLRPLLMKAKKSHV